MTTQSDAMAAAIADFKNGVTNQSQLSDALAPILAGFGIDPTVALNVSNLVDTMQMRMLFGKESNLAAASVTQLIDSPTGVIKITGSSTVINGFGPAPDTTKGGSSIRFIRFQNAQTIAAGVLGTGAVAAGAGECWIMQGLTGSNWIKRA